ncbi:MAG: ATP-binding protein [Lachnospiraceae bacterium]|nr:ATP-binding protein [Lachnospiraceae bacterium]
MEVCPLSDLRDAANDFCTVLGNLLDNAIEACEKLESGRFIRISIRRQETFYDIRVVNSASEELSSAKEDKDNVVGHGLGLRSVERIAHRYGGSLAVNREPGVFTAVVRMEFGA